MRKTLAFLTLPLLAGCLSSTMPAVSHWPLDYVGGEKPAFKATYGIGRVTQVTVRTPYNAEGLAVLRADGTTELDPYNEFVAVPSALLKGVVFDALEASGRFTTVVNASSTVAASTSVEVLVTRLALDCRTEGERKATANVVVRLLRNGEIRGIEKGAADEDAADGNDGRAFSKAVSTALSVALGQFK